MVVKITAFVYNVGSYKFKGQVFADKARNDLNFVYLYLLIWFARLYFADGN